MTLNNRQTAIILAALRSAQRDFSKDPHFFTTHLDSDESPVTLDELDELCEDLNCSEIVMEVEDDADTGPPLNLNLLQTGYGLRIELAKPNLKPVMRVLLDYFENKIRLLVWEKNFLSDSEDDIYYSEDDPDKIINLTDDWDNYGENG